MMLECGTSARGTGLISVVGMVPCRMSCNVITMFVDRLSSGLNVLRQHGIFTQKMPDPL